MIDNIGYFPAIFDSISNTDMEIFWYLKEYSYIVIFYIFGIFCRYIGDLVDMKSVGTKKIGGIEEFFYFSSDSITSRESSCFLIEDIPLYFPRLIIGVS